MDRNTDSNTQCNGHANIQCDTNEHSDTNRHAVWKSECCSHINLHWNWNTYWNQCRDNNKYGNGNTVSNFHSDWYTPCDSECHCDFYRDKYSNQNL